jgi:hypothetical protein
MFIVTVQFEKLKDSEEYKNSFFKNIKTNEEFEKYLQEELETDNIINFITSIARVENIIEGKSINEGTKIPVEELIQKINISENRDKLLKWINESDKKENIKKIINIDNIEQKLEIVEELAKVMKVLAPNISDKIVLKELKKEEEVLENHNNKNKKKNILIIVGLVVLIFLVLGIFLSIFIFKNKIWTNILNMEDINKIEIRFSKDFDKMIINNLKTENENKIDKNSSKVLDENKTRNN